MTQPPKRSRARKPRPPADDEPEVVTAEPVLTPQERGRNGGLAGFKLGKMIRTSEGDKPRWEYIVALVRIGNYASVAAAAAGIDESGYYRYLKTGRAVAERLRELFGEDIEYDDSTVDVPLTNTRSNATPVASENDWLCYRFCKAIEKADAEAEAYAVGVVRRAMGENWTAAMTQLERRHPARWKRRQQHDLTAIVEDENTDDDLLDAPEAVSDVLRRVADSQALPPAKPDDDDHTGA